MPVLNSEEQLKRLREKLRRELGCELLAALADDEVIEILANPDGAIWTERSAKVMTKLQEFSRTRLQSILTTVASMTGNVINQQNPRYSCKFPLDGSRFQALCPPIVASESFALRKHYKKIRQLDHYVVDKSMTDLQCKFLKSSIHERKNLLICGGTSSGKTTLANAILHEACMSGREGERVVVIEDTTEIQCVAPNTISLLSTAQDTLSDLTQLAMRLRPDRVIIGEVRDKSAFDMLYLTNSGHDGSLTTIHASSAKKALHKFERLARESGNNVHPLRIVESFDLVVAIARCERGVEIREIVEVIGHDGEDYRVKPFTPN